MSASCPTIRAGRTPSATFRTRPHYTRKLLRRVEQDALKLCRALGYDLNTVEFAVENGIPYAIDFMNPVPDADLNSVGAANFEWIVRAGGRHGHRQGHLCPPSSRIALVLVSGRGNRQASKEKGRWREARSSGRNQIVEARQENCRYAS